MALRGYVTALPSLVLPLSRLGNNSFRRAELVVANSISDVELRSRISEMLAAKCPGVDAMGELWASCLAALGKKDYLRFVHNVYELQDVVRKVICWEAIAAFVSMEGSEIFAEKILGDNERVGEPSTVDTVKTDKKSEKKKKEKENKRNKKKEIEVVLGKGTSAFLQFIKERLLSGTTKAELEKITQGIFPLLDPKGSGFDDFLVKVKEIVESKETRTLKTPKVQCCHFLCLHTKKDSMSYEASSGFLVNICLLNHNHHLLSMCW